MRLVMLRDWHRMGITLPCLLPSASSCVLQARPASVPASLQAAHADAVTNYKALLQELHLTLDARWHEYRDRIMRDPQASCGHAVLQTVLTLALFGSYSWPAAPEGPLFTMTHYARPLVQGRGSNSALARGEAESLFREHVEATYDTAMESFLDLLEAELKVGWSLLPHAHQRCMT